MHYVLANRKSQTNTCGFGWQGIDRNVKQAVARLSASLHVQGSSGGTLNVGLNHLHDKVENRARHLLSLTSIFNSIIHYNNMLIR